GEWLRTTMAHWREEYRSRRMSAAEAVGRIRTGQRLALHCGCAEPQALVEALVADAERLEDVTLYALTIGSPARYSDPALAGHLQTWTFLCSAGMRAALAAGQTEYLPANLSETPRLFRSGRLPLDVALIQVAPPDEEGYCSLGISR